MKKFSIWQLVLTAQRRHLQMIFPCGRKLCFGFLIGMLLFHFPATGEENESEEAELSTQEFRNRVHEWVELRKEIAAEKREWEKEKDLLEGEKEVLQKRKKEIEKDVEDRNKANSELAERREDLKTELKDFEEVLSGLSEELEDKETFLLRQRQRLPDFLQQQLREKFNALKSYLNSEDKTEVIGKRLQLVLSILQEVQQARNELHCENVEIEIKSGKELELTALYLGLSKAFAVSQDGEYCAVGKPEESGWQWEQAPELASEVARSIAIFKEEGEIDFVNLPVELRE